MLTQDQLAAYFEGQLPADERIELERLLAEEPEAQRALADQQNLHLALGVLLGPAQAHERVKQSIFMVLRGATTEQLTAQVMAETRGAPTARPAPLGRRLWDRLQSWINRDAAPEPTAGGSAVEPAARVYPWLRPALALVSAVVVLVSGLWIYRLSIPATLMPIGEIAAVVGQPTIQHARTRSATVVQRSTPVHLGDRITTGDADRAEIRFRDGTTLRLGFNTVVELPTLNAQRPTSNVQRQTSSSEFIRPSEVRLLAGQIWTKVQTLTNAPEYAIRTDLATAVARGTEFGVTLKQSSTLNSQLSTPTAVLTVKEGTVDFFNSFGSVQATAMTESTASVASAPTEPKRLEALQVVRLSDAVEWSILSSQLDWPDTAERLALGGGWAGFKVQNVFEADGSGTRIRVSQINASGPAALAGLLGGDTVIAVDGQAVTEASQVSRYMLLQPNHPVELTIRRNESEIEIPLTLTQRPTILPGPDLSVDQAGALAEITRPWIELGLDPTAADSPQVLSRDPLVQAAADNNLGVLFEADDALGPAIRAYGRAVRAAPSVPLYRFNLGLALRKMGSFERAAEELAAAVALAPASAEALKRLAEVNSLLDAHDLALEQTEAALAADPGDHGLLELKAQLLSKLGRHSEATETARAAVELAPDCPVARGILGRTLLQQGNLEESEAAYRRAAELSPFEAVFHLNLGSVLSQRGQPMPAEQSFRRALELRPDFVLAHRGLANLLATDRRWAEAADILSRAAELVPDDVGVLRELGNLVLNQGQLDDAEVWFRKALSMVPHDAESHARLGRIMAMRGDLAEAERFLRAARALAPEDSGIHNDLGEVFRFGGQLDEAVECYRRAIELKPDNLDAHNNLAIVHSMRGEYAEAEQFLRTLLEHASNDRRLNPLNFIANLAVVCARQGKLAEAEQFHRQALARAPDDPGLWNSLAWFLADHRLNLDEALSLARRAVKVAPDDPNFLDTLGWVHFQRGELDEAQRILQRALDLAGNSPSAAEIGDHLQQVMARPGTDTP